jgi:hypothetical protein
MDEDTSVWRPVWKQVKRIKDTLRIGAPLGIMRIEGKGVIRIF